MGDVIITSFFDQPKAIPNKCKAAVPEETEDAYLEPKYIANRNSLENERGDLLDSYAYREEDREKVVARAETLLSENYKVIYSVPDEKNREFKTIADDEKEANEQFEAFIWNELWLNEERYDEDTIDPTVKDWKVVSIEKIK